MLEFALILVASRWCDESSLEKNSRNDRVVQSLSVIFISKAQHDFDEQNTVATLRSALYRRLEMINRLWQVMFCCDEM